MTIEATYHGEVRVVRSSYTSKTGPTLTLALHDIDELNKVQGMDGKRYMLAIVEIGDDELPAQQPTKTEGPPQPEKPKGGPLAKLAGMWCNDPKFWEWAAQSCGAEVSCEQHAADVIRAWCEIDSRAELDSSPAAGALFQRFVRGPYMKHLAMTGQTHEA